MREELVETTTLTRLNSVARKQTTNLTHYGRKTGKPHEVTIWFAVESEKLFVGTANVNRPWFRNVQQTPEIKLSIGNETFTGRARFLSNPAEHGRAMATIRRKYWMFWPILALGQLLTAVGLMPDNSGSFEVTLAP